VRALLGHHIVQVACGSRDAQTLALSDEGVVFSWGKLLPKIIITYTPLNA